MNATTTLEQDAAAYRRAKEAGANLAARDIKKIMIGKQQQQQQAAQAAQALPTLSEDESPEPESESEDECEDGVCEIPETKKEKKVLQI